MSSNIQKESGVESIGMKRSHDEFSGDEVAVDDRGLDAGVKQQATDGVVLAKQAVSPAQLTRQSPPPQSSPASLTDAGMSTPARDSLSPNPTPTKNTSPLKQIALATPSSSSAPATQPQQQPVKRKRRTAAEKEAEEREKAQKKKERDEAKQVKQAEKAKADAEKQVKQAEKAKADAEKQARLDEKRRKKEEEEREKEKKERAQPKLMSFFSKAPVTPKKAQPTIAIQNDSPAKDKAAASTPEASVKQEKSEYEKRFPPFFVKENVRMAKNPFEMDEETQVAKSRILDEYLEGKREAPAVKLNPVETFQLPCTPRPRGIIHTPVRHTIEKMQKLVQKAEGADEEDNKAVMKETTEALRKIPVKTLRFYQDLRPPYKGTVTLRPYQVGKDGMRRLARKPTLRNLMPVNYDHDSEAEWESEGEDVDIDDDEEEDIDGEDDMDEFLDDSEDNGPARYVSANGLEPVSTGICWEDQKRMGSVRTTNEHKMEFILENVDHQSGIDPFSKTYWEPESKPRGPKVSKDKIAEPAAPTNAFQAIGTKTNATQPSLPKKFLEHKHLDELKKVIQANPKIAKGGLIDLSYVALAHAKVSRNDIKEAIATIAERNGRGQAGSWVVKSTYMD